MRRFHTTKAHRLPIRTLYHVTHLNHGLNVGNATANAVRHAVNAQLVVVLQDDLIARRMEPHPLPFCVFFPTPLHLLCALSEMLSLLLQ